MRTKCIYLRHILNKGHHDGKMRIFERTNHQPMKPILIFLPLLLAAGSYIAGFSDDVACRIDLAAPRQVVLDGTVGEMTFEDEPALGTMPIGGFREFTGFLDPRISHYSGRVTYRTSATLPAGISKPVTFYSEGEEHVVNN